MALKIPYLIKDEIEITLHQKGEICYKIKIEDKNYERLKSYFYIISSRDISPSTTYKPLFIG
jgi:hypothetical protein